MPIDPMSSATAEPATRSTSRFERWQILAAVIGVANVPLVLIHFRNMWRLPQYQYFPLVLIVIGWLLYRRAERAPQNVLRRRWVVLGAGMLGLSLIIAAGAAWYASPWLAMVASILAFGGLLLFFGNQIRVENAVGIWCLSWLLLRPPGGFDQKLAYWLQGLTSRVSGALLDMAGVVNLVEGNTIILADRHLFVEEACSGIVSLMSIIACCAIVAVWKNRPAPHAVLLTVSGAFWAGVLNVCRIFVMAFALDRMGVDLTDGWKHDALGLVLFAATLGLTLCTDFLLLFLLTPIRLSDTEYSEGTYADDAARVHFLSGIWNTLVQPSRMLRFTHPEADGQAGRGPAKWVTVLAGLFVVVGICQIVRGAMGGDRFARIEAAPQLLALNRESMPSQLGAFELTGFRAKHRAARAAEGEFSRTWEYSGENLQIMLSVDFVFPNWHELTLCYEGIGWNPLDRKVQNRGDEAYAEVTLGRDTGERGFVMFGAVDRKGQCVPPPDSSVSALFRARLNKARPIVGGVYQTQVLVESARPLSLAQKKQVTKAFFLFRDRVVRILTSAEGPGQ